MHKILPTALWAETWRQSQSWFWYLLFAWQMTILVIGFYTGFTLWDYFEAAEKCLSSHDCVRRLEYAEQIGSIAAQSRYSLSTLSVFAVVFSFSVLMQIGWVTAASANTYPHLPALPHYLNGILSLPRSFLLGLLPMRFVAMLMWLGYKSLGSIEVRWQMMIKGRFCQFIITTIIAARVSNSSFEERCEKAAAEHHLELLDAMGTYNLLWLSSVVALILLAVPSYFEWESFDLLLPILKSTPEVRALFFSIVSVPVLVGRLLMYAHFARIINSPAATEER